MNMKKLLILLMILSGEVMASIDYCVVSKAFYGACEDRASFGNFRSCCFNREMFEEFEKYNSISESDSISRFPKPKVK